MILPRLSSNGIKGSRTDVSTGPTKTAPPYISIGKSTLPVCVNCLILEKILLEVSGEISRPSKHVRLEERSPDMIMIVSIMPLTFMLVGSSCWRNCSEHTGKVNEKARFVLKRSQCRCGPGDE